MPTHSDRSAWPSSLQPGAIRFGRASADYDSTIAFYRDLIGLPVIGEFVASFGEEGTIFGLPDTSVQLEIIRAHRPDPAPAFDPLVLYLDDAAAVDVATTRLRAAGVTASPDPHPYWAANGALTVRDPDGRDVVFAPWVFGRDPDPVDRPEGRPRTQPNTEPPLRIEWYEGDRAVLRPLFAEAEDSAEQLDGYLEQGRVLVARHDMTVVGHLQLVALGDGSVELKNMAVVGERRGTGIGRALVDAARAAAADDGARRMLVATAAADVGNLRFYQRCGFRLLTIDRDAFTADTGYPEQIVIDGIPLRDRVWLDRSLGE